MNSLRSVVAVALVSVPMASCVDIFHDDGDGCDDEFGDLSLYMSLPLAVAPPNTFSVTTLDIGQGDAAIVRTPSGCAALFDGGPTASGAVIKANLASLGITRLDAAFVSHYHADHIGALDEVEQGPDGVPITTVYDRGGTYASATYNEYALQYAGRRVTATLETTLTLCNEATFTVVAANANGVATTNENGLSVAVKISFGAFDAVIGGDLMGESPNIEAVAAAGIGEVELYKVHHHGSATSTNQTLADTLRPTVAFISVSSTNSYGHPAATTLSRLAGVGSTVWLTEDPATATKRGHVTLSTATGAEYDVVQGGTTVHFVSKGVAPDTTPPTVPGAPAAAATGTDRIDLSWQASTDDVAVTGYRVERSLNGTTFELLAEAATTAWSDTGLSPATTYWYRVLAADAAGNSSAASAAVSARTFDPADTTPPSQPTGVAATTSETSVSLSWGAATDDVGVAGYTVLRDGAILATTVGTSYVDATVLPSRTYAYAVVARDAADNASAPSSPLSVTTPCDAVITSRIWSTSKKELTVKATCTQTTATLQLSGDGSSIGTMTYSASTNLFTLKKRLAARPACVTVTASCGDVVVSCF